MRVCGMQWCIFTGICAFVAFDDCHLAFALTIVNIGQRENVESRENVVFNHQKGNFASDWTSFVSNLVLNLSIRFDGSCLFSQGPLCSTRISSTIPTALCGESSVCRRCIAHAQTMFEVNSFFGSVLFVSFPFHFALF